jgi:hypothetical protein
MAFSMLEAPNQTADRSNSDGRLYSVCALMADQSGGPFTPEIAGCQHHALAFDWETFASEHLKCSSSVGTRRQAPDEMFGIRRFGAQTQQQLLLLQANYQICSYCVVLVAVQHPCTWTIMPEPLSSVAMAQVDLLPSRRMAHAQTCQIPQSYQYY